MPRTYSYDSDEDNLPAGTTRIGYDADEETYTYRSANGTVWTTTPGNRYSQSKYNDHDDREAKRMFATLFLLIGGFMIGAYWWVGGRLWPFPTSSDLVCPPEYDYYTIRTDDTCWNIANNHGMILDELTSINTHVDCNHLRIGGKLCIHKSK